MKVLDSSKMVTEGLRTGEARPGSAQAFTRGGPSGRAHSAAPWRRTCRCFGGGWGFKVCVHKSLPNQVATPAKTHDWSNADRPCGKRGLRREPSQS